MHLRARGAGGRPDGQHLLGAVLPGARHPARRPDALRQDHRRGGRLLQHLLQRDGGRQARPQGRVRGPGAHRHRYDGGRLVDATFSNGSLSGWFNVVKHCSVISFNFLCLLHKRLISD